MEVLLRKIQQDVRSYNQFPATVDAVDSIVKAFGILERRIEQLSIKVKELEEKPCCKDEVTPTKRKPRASTPSGGKSKPVTTNGPDV
jgi:hypothetical protein